MPQFLPSETKTAIAPIVAKPSGVSCEAELFLGPDALTKIATSGRIPFISTGAAKNVSLPITMPSTPGTYHGYIDVFAGGLRFLAYNITQDILIALPAPELVLVVDWPVVGTQTIAVTAIGGKKFTEVGTITRQTGKYLKGGVWVPIYQTYYCAKLAEPIVVSKLSGLDITFRNAGIYFSADKIGLAFHIMYEPTWPIDPEHEYETQIVCSAPPGFVASRLYYQTYPGLVPFTDTLYVGTMFGNGFSCPGIYNAMFKLYTLRWNSEWVSVGEFIILNAVRCTSTVWP